MNSIWCLNILKFASKSRFSRNSNKLDSIIRTFILHELSQQLDWQTQSDYSCLLRSSRIESLHLAKKYRGETWWSTLTHSSFSHDIINSRIHLCMVYFYFEQVILPRSILNDKLWGNESVGECLLLYWASCSSAFNYIVCVIWEANEYGCKVSNNDNNGCFQIGQVFSNDQFF